MTINEFHREFGRLQKHFRINEDDHDEIVRDWFKALSHYHVDVLSNAIDQVIQDATDTFWPALGKITNAIRSRMSKYEQARNECATCHGNTWILSAPFWSNGLLYDANYVRCPDCGVPPPAYNEPPYRTPLTATEYAQYISGQLPQREIYIAKTHPVVAQALKAIRPMASMKPIAQEVSAQDVFEGEEPT
ncbi:MAG: hypothetical protein EB034_15375 [Verrucomicrobia bacterium]|nr:hypothetical protein [Verrucomicrobiota bacterium]